MKNLKPFLLLFTLIITVNTFAQIRYYGSNRVLNAVNTYNEDGTYIEEFIEKDAGGLSNPQDIILHPDGFLLVTGTNNPRIKKFDLETGNFIEDWSDASFSLTRPSKMGIGLDNKLYVTQWGTTAETSKVVRFNLDGSYLGAFTPSAPQGLGLVWDDNGNLYVSLFGITLGSGSVQKYDSNGTFIETFIDSVILQSPASLWWDNNGDMLVQDYTDGKVLRYSPTGDYIDDFITGLVNPEGHAYLPNGNLLISDRGDNRIMEYEANGNLIGRWDNGGILASPNFIKALDLSILEIIDNPLNIQFLTPTIGSHFNINTDVAEYRLLNILDISGKLIETLDTQNVQSWEAKGLLEGIYFIISQNNLGQRASQRIVIKK